MKTDQQIATDIANKIACLIQDAANDARHFPDEPVACDSRHVTTLSEMFEALVSDRIEAMEVKPNDVIVYSSQLRLSDASKKGIGDQVNAAFPGHNVVILDEGQKMGVFHEA